MVLGMVLNAFQVASSYPEGSPFSQGRRKLGAEVRVCAPPDFPELRAGVGVPLGPIGQPVRLPVTGATPSTERTCPRTRPSWSPPSSKPSPRRPRNVMRRSRRA
jgi:hypothetical protein